MMHERETVSFISRDKYRPDILADYVASHRGFEITSATNSWDNNDFYCISKFLDIRDRFSLSPTIYYSTSAFYRTDIPPHRSIGMLKVIFGPECSIRISLKAYSLFTSETMRWSEFVQKAMSDVEELLKYCRSVGIVE